MTERPMVVVVLAALALLALGGCPKPVPPTPQGITGKDLAERYLACGKDIDAGQWDAFKKDCVVGEFTGHIADLPQTQTGDQLVDFMKSMKSAFPDMKMQPQLVAVSGQDVFAVTLMTGTHDGALKFAGLPDVPATHKRIGTLFFQRQSFADGKSEEWTFSDSSTFMGQLGLLSSEAGPTRPVVEQGWDGAPSVVVSAGEAREKANIEAARKAVDAINAHKPGDAAAMVTDDVIESDQATGRDIKGKDEFLRDLEVLISTFPDVKLDIQNYWSAGDWVISIGTLRGTWKGPMGNFKPTGKTVSSVYADVIKVRDGKAAQIWRFRNGLAIAMQLGVVPGTGLK